VCWPRRHGKTVLVALIVVWKFLTRRTQMIAILANSATQSVDTGFKLAATILRQTPYTATLIQNETIKILGDSIHYDGAGNIIQGYPANPAALFGKKISVAQVTELHAARSQAVFDAVSSATIDTDDAMVLVDSTVGPRSSPLYGLYQLFQKKADEALYFSFISYKNLAEALEKSPHWINRKGLKSQAAKMLPLDFAQQHLNLWGSASNSLFPKQIIDSCKDRYPQDIPAIVGNAAYVVGAGLDRAYGFSLHGDATIATAVLKTIKDEDEHYFVLASDKIKFSSASGIRKKFTKYHADWNLKRVSIEAYNAQDVASWCAEQDFEHEIVHATAERQANAFTALYNAAAEGRLHIRPDMKLLLSEMGDFEYRMEVGQAGQSLPKFEHAKGSHDDTIYSLAWAIYALRNEEINPYEVDGIYCNAQHHVARLCVLNGGEHVPLCADQCRSFSAINRMYQEFANNDKTNDMGLQFFVKNKIENIGPHVTTR
jgi:hypothetical protein